MSQRAEVGDMVGIEVMVPVASLHWPDTLVTGCGQHQGQRKPHRNSSDYFTMSSIPMENFVLVNYNMEVNPGKYIVLI